MPENRTRTIAVIGSLGAVSVLLGLTHWGFIPWFGGVSLTIMHVPVIIGAILEGPVAGLVIGLIFGIFSLVQAATAPLSPYDILFTNPLISVLPRLLIGPLAYLGYRLFASLPRLGEVIGWGAAGVVGSLTNTVLVLLSLHLVAGFPAAAVVAVGVANGPLEAAVSAAITMPVVAALKRVIIGNRTGARL